MALRQHIDTVNREIKLDQEKKATFSDAVSLRFLSELKWSMSRYLQSGNKTDFEYIANRNEHKKLVVEYYLRESGIPYTMKETVSINTSTYYVKNEDLQ